MRLKNIELERLIPLYLREDKNYQGIIYALEGELKLIDGYIELIKLYLNMETIQEKILDELAWQFNVPEYDVQFDVEIKRSLIKDCLSIHHKRGTVSAVEEVAVKIFGNAVVTEWFEYGGEPYHFKVSTSNITSDDEMIARFHKIVKETQNVRSHLEEVVVEIMEALSLYIGVKAIITDDIILKTVDIYG